MQLMHVQVPANASYTGSQPEASGCQSENHGMKEASDWVTLYYRLNF